MFCWFVYFGTQPDYSIDKMLIFSNVAPHSICVTISTTDSQLPYSSPSQSTCTCQQNYIHNISITACSIHKTVSSL
uniref:Ovule protein n=1 Tax=Schistosoma mansoni TaxID=6183 RepID=A0A5K4F7B9_SCHMA